MGTVGGVCSLHFLCLSCLPPCPAALKLPLDDGSWHLLGVTTRPEGGDGFQLYVDGALVGEVGPGVLYPGAQQPVLCAFDAVWLAAGKADAAVALAGSSGRQPFIPSPTNPDACPALS